MDTLVLFVMVGTILVYSKQHVVLPKYICDSINFDILDIQILFCRLTAIGGRPVKN